jgi:hypothetical protein
LLGVAAGLLLFWGVAASISQHSYDWPGAAAAALLIALPVQVLRSLRPARESPPPSPSSRLRPATLQFRDALLIRERLRWGRQSPDRFANVVTPLLRELADERLSRRRGLDRSRDRQAVERLLGGDLLAMIENPAPAAVPTTSWLDDAIRRIEQI